VGWGGERQRAGKGAARARLSDGGPAQHTDHHLHSHPSDVGRLYPGSASQQLPVARPACKFVTDEKCLLLPLFCVRTRGGLGVDRVETMTAGWRTGS
jgi:hypothetical protein